MNWRLVLDGADSGAWNMARDEALLLCQSASTLPVLRFYDWQPACVSIGRLQRNFPPFQSAIRNSQIAIVRRPTGGRAVLHQHEITYCAAIHETRLPRESRSVVGAYNWLARGFLEGLKTLGVEAQLAEPHGASTRAATNCFQSAAQCDFLAAGKKLIGAAQCRKNGVILQHGSILLEVDEAAWQNTVGGAMAGAVSLRALGVLVSREELVEAFGEGFARAGNISFVKSSLSEEERQMASRLHKRKYTRSEWNENGRE